MKLNTESMSLPELKALNERVTVAIEAAREREKAQLKAEMQALAAKRGLTLSEILGPAKPGTSKPRQVVCTPWRDRKTGATWAGRGRYPQGFDKSRAE